MRSKLRLILTCAVCCAVVSSCANRVETRAAFPDVADLQTASEPPYPIDALTNPDKEAARKAEEAWWNQVLIWGRAHHDRLARVCGFYRDLGMKLPEGYCGL